MSQKLKDSSPHGRSQWYWRVVLIAAPVGLLFGVWGYRIYFLEQHSQTSLLSCVYYTIQLFGLRMPQLTGHINLSLEISRWATALSAGLAVLLLLRRLFLIEWRLIRLQWTKNHVVVCGLGRVGGRLALEFRSDGEKVIAIERAASAAGIAEAESRGITVVIGDAKDPKTLYRVGAHRAKKVLAVCSDDDTNIAIAAEVGNLIRQKNPAPAEAVCLLLINDPALRAKIAQYFKKINNLSGYQVKIGGLDIPDTVARCTFENHPLDFSGIREGAKAKVHLVLVGTCGLAEALAVKALQLCHFANGSRLRLSVAGSDSKGFLNALRKKHPFARPWYDSDAIECDREDSILPRKIVQLAGSDELLTVAICPPSGDAGNADTRNFVLAMEFKKVMDEMDSGHGPAQSQILVHSRNKTGFENFFESLDGLPAIHAFGLMETFCNRDLLLQETQDALARALHEDYRRNHGGPDWNGLVEEFRDSNRLAADHIPIKLKAIGLRMVKKGKSGSKKITAFEMPKTEQDEPDHNLVLLSKMEHSRWCAERFLSGWRLGIPKDREEKIRKKISKDLVPWSKLHENERKKDWEQICIIPEVLTRIGKGIA